MSHEKFLKYAKATGGLVTGTFSQGLFMDEKGFSKMMRGGCCLAFTSAWISCDGDCNSFTNYIQTGDTWKKVQAVQMLYKLQKSGSNGSFGSLDMKYLDSSFLSFGVEYDKKLMRKQKLHGNSIQTTSDQLRIAKFVGNKQGAVQFHFQGKGGGHAIGFYNDSGSVGLFDPNYGQVEFKHHIRLTQFMMLFFKGVYPTLAGNWYCVRAKL